MCHDDDSHPPMPLSEGSGARGQDVTLTSSDGTRVAAYFATPADQAEAQIVILPDIRGLHRFYKELALRFADVGVRALAIDYFARTSSLDQRDDSTDFRALAAQMTPESFGADLAAAVEYLRQGEGRDLATFTVGFCLGGSLSFRAGSQGLDLAGVIGFYGGLSRQWGAVTPSSDYASRIRSPVLGLFGGADAGIPQEDIGRFTHELDAAGVEHEITVYPGAPHSFFDKKATEFATASADAWGEVQAFIARHQRIAV